jgi:DNA-binding IclR family transcriptional regulator
MDAVCGNMAREAKHPVDTVRKTIRILEALKESDGTRVTELAASLGTSKSTVHNHLSTLREEGFVVRDGTEYRLGLRFLEFGGYSRSRTHLYRVAEPEIERLAERTGEMASLLTEQHGQGVYLLRSKGSQAVALDTHAGYRCPLHVTALGKAILAHLPEDRVAEIINEHGLEARTPETITDRGALFDELGTVRERGFALDDEEHMTGLRCVGAPITTTDGAVVGAVSVSAPTSRMRDDRFTDEVPDLVRSAANVVELNLNHS